MEDQRCMLVLFILVAVCFRETLTHTQTSTDVDLPLVPASHKNTSMYAWSTWGSWSACSRPCGGGVAVQQRHCLPRDPTRWRRSRKRRKLVRDERVRRARTISGVVTAPDCAGLGRRYHECNTAACPGVSRDGRGEQCASYDRRPFRGRFYTWVPYVDGNAPCVLNCRPRGQQFYASLSLVSDGTPCTKPGLRAICVQGICKVVGREDVLASTATRDVTCGRRLVSGLFSRPRLPLGYSSVTTVPRGACRLNVSEIVASENYIALRVSNGSYIVNGEFAVSAPGTYEAAGARFIYSRSAGLDNIFAMGPIHQPIDIMVLYTQPNPNIKYEYLTDSLPDETSNDIPNDSGSVHHQMQRHHRHHTAESHTRALDKSGPSLSKHSEPSSSETRYQIDSNVIGDRRFVWKVLSYTQCSRTCGGGLQIGKFKCVEVDGKEDREISPAHCKGSPPPSRRRRCGAVPCPPRWRAAAWGPCPVCGPAHRTRIVGCVQDHARGITKISDQKCPLPMPPNKEPCNIPNCDGTSNRNNTPRLDTRRHVTPYERVDSFREGSKSVITLASNVSANDIPTHESKYSFSAAGGWLYTEWSQCVGWCVGGGVQSRGVRCSQAGGCSSRGAPAASQPCSFKKQCDAQWFTGDWSPCSAACDGRQIRGVICIGSTGRRLRDGSCKIPRPEAERSCGGNCAPSWYLSDWGDCSGPCEAGVQTRTVRCTRGAGAGGAGAGGAGAGGAGAGGAGAGGAGAGGAGAGGAGAGGAGAGGAGAGGAGAGGAGAGGAGAGGAGAGGAGAGGAGAGGAGAGGAGSGAVRGEECGVSRPAARRSCVPARCTTRPLTPAVISDVPTDPQQRVTRHQSQNIQNVKERSYSNGTCSDKLSNCSLAVQARLCHYRYYADSCCHSCHGR